MRTLKTLKPGKRGTRELLSRYGSSLLCVRYRYDERTRERLFSPSRNRASGITAGQPRQRSGYPKGGSVDRVAGEGPSAACQVGWRPVGSVRSGGFGSCIGTRSSVWIFCIGSSVQAEVARYGNLVDRCRNHEGG